MGFERLEKDRCGEIAAAMDAKEQGYYIQCFKNDVIEKEIIRRIRHSENMIDEIMERIGLPTDSRGYVDSLRSKKTEELISVIFDRYRQNMSKVRSVREAVKANNSQKEE